LAVRPTVNALAPIRTLLLDGEMNAKQAETHLDFRRPDIALQEYMKASIIAVDLIPRHKDYPTLIADRGELHRLYAGLQKRISSQHERFEDIKKQIKENNIRNGVQPMVRDTALNGIHSDDPGPIIASSRNGNVFSSATVGGVAPPSTDMSPLHNIEAIARSQKPAVRPKPGVLHSKAIGLGTAAGTDGEFPEEDLTSRFARLRSPAPVPPVQDPRIRTRPIASLDASDSPAKLTHLGSQGAPLSSQGASIHSRPLGPREMPKQASAPPRPQKVPLDVVLPGMPRLPDAIYSPTRNVDISATLDAVQIGSRNAPSIGTNSSHVSATNGVQRTSSHRRELSDHQPTTTTHQISSRKLVDFQLPDSAAITAEELMGYLRRGSHELYILLVDLRNREDFDSGHIMSHSIICVEPIVLRRGMSAEDLGQTLVLSPESEQVLYESRDSFDLIVYYDQSSTLDGRSQSGTLREESPLADFCKAVYEYGYEKRPRRRPRQLVGGLDAWIDLVGIGALQMSQTLSQTPGRRSKTAAQISGRGPMARETRRLLARRRMDYESRPLSKEAELKWEKALREEEAATIDDIPLVRTTEDFFRRFPDATAIQESMVSAPSYAASERHVRTLSAVGPALPGPAQDGILDMPRIPTRPAPAVPRDSYSGISEKKTLVTSTSGSGHPAAFRETDTISHVVSRRRHTGLTNFRMVTCYMNAITQALNWTDIFSDYLIRFPSTPNRRVPRKKGEDSDPPQLMAQNIGQVFRQLSSGRWENYTPDLFRVSEPLPLLTCITNAIQAYVNDIHRKSTEAVQAFGGPRQQDAEEFLSFLLEVLEDELNVARDKGPLLALTPAQEEVRRQQPLIKSSWMEWQRYQYSHRSFITQSFCGQSVTDQTCNHCGFVQRAWDTWMTCPVDIEHMRSSRDKSLERALGYRFGRRELLEDYKCDKCKHTGATRTETISRCPEILVIMLRRTLYVNNRTEKSHVAVSFPLDNLSMDPYFISLEGRGTEQLDRSFLEPFRYDCYAVVQHQGNTIDAGHYWAFVRDLQSSTREDWYKFEDTRPIVPVKDIRKASQNALSYLLFYRRQLP
jgi:ubiquitin carboxyl-terminal hydrolase 8